MSKTESRLGRGLGALLGEYLEDEPGPEEVVREVQLARVRPNPFQPRTEFAEGALDELVESIRANGLLQPLVVRPVEGGFELVAGERRMRALGRLGHERAAVVVRELTDEQMVVLALVENLQREALSPLEEASAYQELIDHFGLTQQEVADRVGRDRSTVANALRLRALPRPVRELVAAGKLSAGHARAILGVRDEQAQLRLARSVVDRGLSVRETERRARRIRELGSGNAADGAQRPGSASAGDEAGDPVARRAERSLARALGTAVKIKLRGSARGEIRVGFRDAAEFERLTERLLGREQAAELFGA